jgi:hypothetical protein
VRTAIAVLQGIFIAAAVGIIIYVIVEASDVFTTAGFCRTADDRATAGECVLAPTFAAQATALVAWALVAVGLAICAAAIRWWGGPARPKPQTQAWPPPAGQWPGQQGR